jgi:hypothetical protein
LYIQKHREKYMDYEKISYNYPIHWPLYRPKIHNHPIYFHSKADQERIIYIGNQQLFGFGIFGLACIIYIKTGVTKINTEMGACYGRPRTLQHAYLETVARLF